MLPPICEDHRKELLRFLLVKTAAVRSGLKPAELLRVRHCYRMRNAEGFQFCLYRRDIFHTLRLDYLELRAEPQSSLALFYHPERLCQELALPEKRAILTRCGYPENATTETLLTMLRERFSREFLPHEVGVFIGYPAKDVVGFMDKLPRTPVHRGGWLVFGNPEESLSRMQLYRQIERFADRTLDTCTDLQDFFNRINRFNPNHRRYIHG